MAAVSGRGLSALLFAAAMVSCGSPGSEIRRLEHRRDAVALAKFAHRPEADVRRAAARAMGRVQSWESTDELIALTRDSAAFDEAVFALGQLGFAETPDAAAAARAIDHLFRLPRSARTVEAIGKLGRAVSDTGAVATALIEAGRDPASEVRAQAASGLMRTFMERKERPDPVARALIELARDADAEVRMRAGVALTRPPDPRAAEAYAKLAADPDRWCRILGARALGRIKSGVEVLRAACGDADALVRAEAVSALGAAGAPVPEAALSDASFHVRAAAVKAMGVDADFEAAWIDPSRTVRLEGVLALGRQKNAVKLAEIAENEDPWVRVRAAEAAGMMGPEGLDLLKVLSSDPQERVRAAVVEAAPPTAPDLVLSALSDPGLSVRGGAISALAKRKDPGALPPLLDCYRASMAREWIEVREGIVDALAAIEGGRESLGGIADSDPAPSVRAKAARALGRPSVPRAEDPDRAELLSVRFDRNPRVILQTEKGSIAIECFAAEAPVHVANFVGLVKRGFYDGLTFHRVVPNFVIQGGDPRGDGWGDAGYNLRDEINAQPYARGTLGMPKAGKDTGGCQIFITHTPTPHLDGRYTVFGHVVDGDEVIDKIEIGDRIVRARVLEP